MIISVATEKAFEKNPTLIHDKKNISQDTKGKFSQLDKNYLQKLPTANIILNGDKFKAIPLRSSTRQACPCSPLLFNII